MGYAWIGLGVPRLWDLLYYVIRAYIRTYTVLSSEMANVGSEHFPSTNWVWWPSASDPQNITGGLHIFTMYVCIYCFKVYRRANDD